MPARHCFTCAPPATAPARPHKSPPPVFRVTRLALAAFTLFSTFASTAEAQVTGDVGVQNSYRIRGYSVVDGHPVATLDLYYEHPSGVYSSLSGLVEFEADASPEVLGYVANIGYARRVGPEISIDGGVVRTQFARYAITPIADAHYDDLYIGRSRKSLSARLHYSPDYYRSGVATVYGELDGSLKRGETWRLTGHVGLLGYVAQPMPLNS
jgi:uncharacterized protein (TIGR02001 family)